MGSDYETSEEENENDEEYYSEVSSFNNCIQFSESEQQEEEDEEAINEENMESSRFEGEESKLVIDMVKIKAQAEKELPFNAIRYLGEALKKLS